jgi:hypothetical protein
MSVLLAPGVRLRSAVCTTEVIVVRVDDPGAAVECGGRPMLAIATATETAGAAPAPGFDAGSVLGKRYGGSHDAVELLCTKAGGGSVSVGGVLLAERRAKALPASD